MMVIQWLVRVVVQSARTNGAMSAYSEKFTRSRSAGLTVAIGLDVQRCTTFGDDSDKILER